ncbi:MAG: hypothetical protein DMD54_15660 [Gemmatimonadetes bacterium]|nr:MAG: hypothetical protein DMD54_15660 [Gemmatimonadota bacterium]
MYEPRHVPPLSRRRFMHRWVLHFGVASVLVVGSLTIGMAGYEHFERLAWRDAFMNSAMLLAGMGPVNAPQSNGGKMFAGFYALYAGLIFIVVAALLGAPLFHRILHKLHWLDDQV